MYLKKYSSGCFVGLTSGKLTASYRLNNVAIILTLSITYDYFQMPEDTPCVIISTDGACSGNPGPGGWAARLRFFDGSVHELGGGAAETTNNRMEMQAAIEGLKYAGDAQLIVLNTDSEYLRRGITEWIHNWKRRGWKTASKKPVLNQDLWQQLDAVNSDRVRWEYTKGHAGDPDNERCDQIAVAYSPGLEPELIQQD